MYYELVTTYHPNFNIWRRIKGGYLECYWKDEDPNQIIEHQNYISESYSENRKRIAEKKRGNQK